jgi:hypothetical protein
VRSNLRLLNTVHLWPLPLARATRPVTIEFLIVIGTLPYFLVLRKELLRKSCGQGRGRVAAGAERYALALHRTQRSSGLGAGSLERRSSIEIGRLDLYAGVTWSQVTGARRAVTSTTRISAPRSVCASSSSLRRHGERCRVRLR